MYRRKDGLYSPCRIVNYYDKYDSAEIETEKGSFFKINDMRHDDRLYPRDKYCWASKGDGFYEKGLKKSGNSYGSVEWQEEQSLALRKEEDMSNVKDRNKILALLMQEGELVTVKCEFTKGGKLYTFVCCKEFAATLKKGDNCIVPNQYATEDWDKANHPEVSTVRVVEIDSELDIDPEVTGINYKPLLQKLKTKRFTKFSNAMKQNVKSVEHSRRRKAVQDVMKDVEF